MKDDKSDLSECYSEKSRDDFVKKENQRVTGKIARCMRDDYKIYSKIRKERYKRLRSKP